MEIRVFTSFYSTANPARKNELIASIFENTQCDSITKVCLYLENTDTPFSHPKLVTKTINQRPKYIDFIDWANELVTESNDTTVICNSDISFDKSIGACSRALRPNECAALARWDLVKDGPPKLYYTPYAQDAWIFSGKIRDIECNFNIGVSGCDNRFMHELFKAGYNVINPALSIKSYHRHDAPTRKYGDDSTKSVGPPYKGMYPHNLHNLPRTVWQNTLNKSEKQSWYFDWRLTKRSVRKLLVACKLINPRKRNFPGNSLPPM